MLEARHYVNLCYTYFIINKIHSLTTSYYRIRFLFLLAKIYSQQQKLVLFTSLFINHNLDLCFNAQKGERLLTEATGSPFKLPENLISQPSTFFGTQASNKICPRTVFVLILGLGRWGDLCFCSSMGSGSLLFRYSDELGVKKRSLGSSAALLELWFETAAALRRSQSCIFSMLDFSPSFRIFSEKTETACSSNSVIALHCIVWCRLWPVQSKQSGSTEKKERKQLLIVL